MFVVPNCGPYLWVLKSFSQYKLDGLLQAL